MLGRITAGAAALAFAAGAHAGLFSFAAGSSNVDRLFEINTPSDAEGGGPGVVIESITGATVVLMADPENGGSPTSRTVNFHASFSGSPLGFPIQGNGGGLPFVANFLLEGFFSFSDTMTDEILAEGSFSNGILSLVFAGDIFGGAGEGLALLAGAIIAPEVSYSIYSALGDGFADMFVPGDAGFTLTNFSESPTDGGTDSARADSSFSGSFIPNPGTGVLLGAAGLVAMARRRR